ncbi:MAG: fused MFS/spermidine synthase, partial [Chloroflexota bacterium]
VIGVILAGMSLGNYLGGRLADRRASPGLLGVVFAVASLATLSILWLNNDLHDIKLPTGVPFFLWVVVYIAAVFMLPSVILGCVSPIVVKLSLTDLQRTGTTVGKIYAWSTVGSILGTFLTGFVLIAYIGTKTTILGVAGVLMLIGLWFLTDRPWRQALWRGALAVVLFGGGLAGLWRLNFLNSECMLETNYFCINVHEVDKDGRKVRELLLDRLVHSYTDMQDPTHLVYGYEQTYAAIIKPLTERKPDLEAHFIGGGGYTFPRYMEATLPESHIVVSEIDPGVTEAATNWLNLAPDTRIESHNLDARIYFAWHAQPRSYDLVFGDAFNDFSVPSHLTTLEFNLLVANALREDGLYLVNIIDGGPFGNFFRAYVRTLQRVFRHVVVIPSDPSWRAATRTTFVIAASQAPLDLSQLPVSYAPLPEAELEEYLNAGRQVILTDDYVPSDNLMAPVVSASFSPGGLDADVQALIRQRVFAVGGGVLALAAAVTVLLLRRRRAHGADQAPTGGAAA